MRIAICWELGGGLGHVANIWPLANALRQRGHTVDFIVADLARAGPILGQLGESILQAPVWHGANGSAPQASYAEILVHGGYASEQGLHSLVSAWLPLLDHLKPDLVIADFAPTAMLASRARPDRRTVAIGSGFFLPPHATPLPSFRSWERVSPQRLQTTDQLALDNCNRVLAKWNVEPLATLADLIRADGQLLMTWPELDHYGSRPGATYWGPVTGLPDDQPFDWPCRSDTKVFAYLKPEHSPELIVAALAEQPISALVAVPGLAKLRASTLTTPQIRVVPHVINARLAIEQSTHVICHAGLATVAQALLAARPVLLLPTNAEQYAFSLCAAKTGATEVLVEREWSRLGTTIACLITSAQHRDAARAFAAKYVGFDATVTAQRMAAWCEHVVGGNCASAE